MSGQDAGFLHLESPASPMNTMILVDLGGGPGAAPVSLADVAEHVAQRLALLPSLRWRVVEVPGGLSHPVYVEDPSFDLGYHLRTVTVEAPGDDGALDELFASLAEQHLDDRHPRWQFLLVDGLADGRQVLILRFQHCLLDGVGVVTTLTRLFGPLDATPPPDTWTPEPIPTKGKLVASALRDLAHEARHLPTLVGKTKRNVAAVRDRQASSSVEAPEFVKDTPACSLNDAFTRRRSYARVALPLADLKRVKEQAGVSLNDVALAVTAGGLRRMLRAQGDLPTRPLTASVPVSFEPPGAEPRQWGNRFSSLTTSLCTDIEDPHERLRAISRVTSEAKLRHDLQGPELMVEWLDALPPFVAARTVAGHRKGRAADRTEADTNVVISNLRGPTERWTFLGRTIVAITLDGPPSIGVGPNVMLWSYAEHLYFGILSFADAVPEPDRLAQGIRDELEALLRE